MTCMFNVEKNFPLQDYQKARLQTGAVHKHFPLQILYEKVSLQTRAVLKHFLLQVLYEKARLRTGHPLHEMWIFETWKSEEVPGQPTGLWERFDYRLELI